MNDDVKLSLAYDYAPISTVCFNDRHTKYETVYPIKTPINIISPNTLLGVEIEIENMGNDPEINFWWEGKADNSLRNNGIEYTTYPLRANQLEHAWDYLQKRITSKCTPEYSSRTSIHVHVNVRDFTLGQLKSLVLLYCLFEKHFFALAGGKRESSIFCVPLYKTNPPHTISRLEDSLNYWHKYFALNLTTVFGTQGLPAYGTIEFRHFYGTDNKNAFFNWINNILKLVEASKKFSIGGLLKQVQTMNTTSEYLGLYQTIFEEYALHGFLRKADFESCVSFVKRWEWGDKLNKKYSYKKTSVLAQKRAESKTQKNLIDPWFVQNMHPNTPFTTIGGLSAVNTVHYGVLLLCKTLEQVGSRAVLLESLPTLAVYKRENGLLVAVPRWAYVSAPKVLPTYEKGLLGLSNHYLHMIEEKAAKFNAKDKVKINLTQYLNKVMGNVDEGVLMDAVPDPMENAEINFINTVNQKPVAQQLKVKKTATGKKPKNIPPTKKVWW